MYVIVIIAVTFSVYLVLHLSYEKSEEEALEEEDEDEDEDEDVYESFNGSLSQNLEIANRSMDSPMKTRRPSFDSDDEDLQDITGGKSSIIEALKSEQKAKSVNLHFTSNDSSPLKRTKDIAPIVNIRSQVGLMSESKSSFSPQRTGQPSMFEMQLSQYESREDDAWKRNVNNHLSTPATNQNQNALENVFT